MNFIRFVQNKKRLETTKVPKLFGRGQMLVQLRFNLDLT
jgi:hypothetical protein